MEVILVTDYNDLPTDFAKSFYKVAYHFAANLKLLLND